MCKPSLALAVLGILLSSANTAKAQEETRPLAITKARILTAEGNIIENGTILIRNGKIVTVGAKVTIPPGAKIIDAKGGSVMPGLVSAWSRAGVSTTSSLSPRQQRPGRGSRRSRPSRNNSSKAKNRAAHKIADGIYARQDVFGELLQSGVTTLAVHPEGSGFAGQAALLDLAATNGEQLTIDDQLFLTVIPEKSTAGKKLCEDSLDAASKVREAKKNPKDEPAKKEPEQKTASKPKSKPTKEPAPEQEGDKDSTKKPAPKQQPKQKKTEPNTIALVALLEGKTKAFVTARSATDLSHYLGSLGEHRYTTTIVAASQGPQLRMFGRRRRGGSNPGGSLTLMLDELKRCGADVLMDPQLTTKAGTNILINEAAILDAAGIEVGFSIGDSKAQVRALFFKLIDLIRHGLSPDTALRAVTSTPAKMLRVDKNVGSIKAGKQANLLLFSGDPFDPSSKMLKVFYRGKEINEG